MELCAKLIEITKSSLRYRKAKSNNEESAAQTCYVYALNFHTPSLFTNAWWQNHCSGTSKEAHSIVRFEEFPEAFCMTGR